MSKTNTPEFRVAFPSVFQTKYNTMNKKDEYSVVALFPKGTDMAPLVKAANEALQKKFGKDKSKWPGDIKKYRSPFRDQGDREKIDKETGKKILPQGYVKGCTYLNLRSTQRPGVVERNESGEIQDIIDTADFYGGCWAIASINAYGYEKGENRGVNFGLGNLIKLRDGDAFGNRTKPQDDFSAVETSGPAAENDKSASGLFT